MTGRLALVFELMEMNLYELVKGRTTPIPEHKVKLYIYQLLKSIDHMHRNGIFHRDIKPENVLIKDDIIKLADFGSCRGMYSKQPFTEYISTRWYRPPECLLTDGYYGYKMDIWGVGCVFFEILSNKPLFPGKNELDQVHQIHHVLGTPSAELLEDFQKKASHMTFNFPEKQGTGFEHLIPHASPAAKALISKMLAYREDERISSKDALNDPFFKDMRESDRPTKLVKSPSPILTNSEPDFAAGTDGYRTHKDESSILPPIKNVPYVPKKKKKGPAETQERSPASKYISLDAIKPQKKTLQDINKAGLSPYLKKTVYKYKSYYK